MRLNMVAFTRAGVSIATTIATKLESQGDHCQVFSPAKWADVPGVLAMELFLEDWTRWSFSSCDGLIFIGACGIAVRAVAPHLRGKDTDPAVVVVDTAARFAISLLSGHLGGANQLAERVAASIGATAVITTATDSEGLFAVDSWASQQGLAILELSMVKKISAALLEGEPVGFHSTLPHPQPLPKGLSQLGNERVGISVSHDVKENPYPLTLHLIPRNLVLGIGCRRGISGEQLEWAVRQMLEENGFSLAGVCAVSSIDLKENEAGLHCFAQKYCLPLHFYTAQELEGTLGAFTSSKFVLHTTGVDNVCERAAVKTSGGKLLLGKTVLSGVTVALAERPLSLDFPHREEPMACQNEG